jgi:HSP20 family protein
MNELTRRNTFHEMQELHHRLNRLLDAGLGRRGYGDESFRAGVWEPAVDIFEDKKEYIIQADLPGIRKQDVEVTFENGVLRLAGERKQNREGKDRRYLRAECPYGSFHRSFTLPGDTAAGQIHAEFKDGVLRVRVAKSESARPKQIAVS